jgi:MOSC domain-containing protein YiiM
MLGCLVAIYTAPAAGASVRAMTEVEAVAGRGLAGDRYAAGEGSFSRWPGKGRDVTLISADELEAAGAEFGVDLAEGQHRRNLVVEGVPLEDLRGVPFRIGGVAFEGVRLCAPCKYLVRVTGQDRIFDALVKRGGLRASVLDSGSLRVGDPVSWDPVDIARRRSLPG